jgi:predicted TIM-barrel fold metal-dependent hydrolase
MLIDVHTHVFPDKIATRAVDSLAKRANLPLPELDGTVTGLLGSMSSVGIDCSWIANIATRPEQAGSILDWSKLIRSDKIMPLASVHPDSATWKTEVFNIFEAGLRGIKFHPQYQGFVVDDPRLLPIYREIARLGLFVLFHAGYDLAFLEDNSAAPFRLANVHRKVPELTMIAAHLGGWRAWDEVIDCLVGSEVYFDTSFMHDATPRQREHIFLQHDRTRILFGSDSPWTSQKHALEQVHALPLDAEHRAQVLGGNAERLVRTLESGRRRSRP